MRTALVTGSEGFLGRNLCLALQRCQDVEVLRFDVGQTLVELEQNVARADFIFHFAGVNRPKDVREYQEGNTDLTGLLCQYSEKHGRRAPILMSSSTQAEQDNPYGQSKRAAEELLAQASQRAGFPVLIYRFPNLFGKWSRPNYNSVVSTFCHNVAHGLPLQVNDPAKSVTFAYVDDVVEECLRCFRQADELDPQPHFHVLEQTYTVTLGRLAELVQAFGSIRTGGVMPDLADPFVRKLYSTFLSYYEPDAFAYPVDLKQDHRGWLFEFLKSEHFGQIFLSKTLPGVTRGNHGHDSKVEKFCVLQGSGTIRLRHLVTGEITAYEVSDESIRIVDIPPGYTHSIENTGDAEMLTLFWANEVFDPDKPDTYFEPVLPE